MNKFAKVLLISVLFISMVPKVAFAEMSASEREQYIRRLEESYPSAVFTTRSIDRFKSSDLFTNQSVEEDIDKDEELHYKVEEGDTLFAISQEYEVTVEELMVWNELTSDLILIDQELVINPEMETVDLPQEESEEVVEAVAEPVQQEEDTEQVSVQRTMTMTATAYTAECDGCSGITATGINLLNDRNKKVVAVDPDIIPLGSLVYVEGYGEAIAGDVGGAIKGNKIDIHVPTKEEAFQWGVREVTVEIISEN